jgi:DNA-binding MarR family transcriptional regulator
MEDIKLRDKRKPGHCWQDNELYDAFQPIVGPHAVLVYVHLTRESYSATVSYSLRKLADATGISRSAVWRNLAVLEYVGILRLQRGEGSAQSTCVLLDLKEAAERLGAVYNRKRSSYVFTDVAIAKLRAEVTALRKRLHQSKANEICVSLGDTKSEENFCAPVSQGDASVSLRGDLCLPEGGPHQYCEQNTIHNTNPPPTPSLLEGGVLEDALEYVMRECGFTSERIKRALRKQLALWKARNTGKAYDAADEFISSWHEYCKVTPFLRIQWGPWKFIAEGHWLRPDSWPLDQQALARWRESRVGVRQ